MSNRPTTITRRSPQQQRSQEKVDRILSALETLLKHQRLQDISVTRLITKSGVPAGTFYGYFRNIEDVTEQVATRFINEVGDVVATWRNESTVDTWQQALEGLISAYVEWATARPAFLQLWASEQFGTSLREFEQESNEHLTDLFKSVILSVEPSASSVADHVFRFVIELVDRMTRFSFREENEDRRSQIIAESALAARSYLSNYLSPTRPDSAADR